jgi:hypothetical protein
LATALLAENQKCKNNEVSKSPEELRRPLKKIKLSDKKYKE